MIIHLQEGRATINRMVLPELATMMFVQFEFEENTEHLIPVLTLNRTKFVGDRKFQNLKDLVSDGTVSFTVELLDAKQQVLHTYKGEVPTHHYIVFGERPVRPDAEVYIRSLQDDIKKKENEIKRLNELGEVV